MINNPFKLFVFVSIIVVINSCHKQDPTVINLKVVDAFTGLPLDSVHYYLYTNFRYDDGSYKKGEHKRTRGGITDATGMINYTFEEDENGDVGTLENENYIIKNYIRSSNNEHYIVQGVYNEFDVKLRPFDAFLKVNIQNTGMDKDDLYLIIRSATLQNEDQYYTLGHKIGFPYSVGPLQDTSILIPTVANEDLFIYWKWDFIDGIQPGSPRSQLVIPRGDTLSYFISN